MNETETVIEVIWGREYKERSQGQTESRGAMQHFCFNPKAFF